MSSQIDLSQRAFGFSRFAMTKLPPVLHRDRLRLGLRASTEIDRSVLAGLCHALLRVVHQRLRVAERRAVHELAPALRVLLVSPERVDVDIARFIARPRHNSRHELAGCRRGYSLKFAPAPLQLHGPVGPVGQVALVALSSNTARHSPAWASRCSFTSERAPVFGTSRLPATLTVRQRTRFGRPRRGRCRRSWRLLPLCRSVARRA